eukprot:jgi/Mesen1/7666/ME000400S06857
MALFSASMGLLLLALVVVSQVAVQASESPVAPTGTPGLFYLFVNGKIVLLDAASGQYVKTIDNFGANGVPFPNNCTGNPFKGKWNDQVVGKDGQTIFMTSAYEAAGDARLPGLEDYVYVVDTTKREIAAQVPALVNPLHIYYTSVEDNVWAHSDAEGPFTVLNASAPFALVAETVGKGVIPGHGKLINDDDLGSKAYATSVSAPGIFKYNLSNPGVTNDNPPFLNFTGISDEHGNPVICYATHGAAYSPVSKKVYINCVSSDSTPAEAPKPGTVVFDPSDDTVHQFYNWTGGSVIPSPDSSYVLLIQGGRDTIHLLKVVAPTAAVGSAKHEVGTTELDDKYYQLLFKNGSYPSSILFYPKAPSHVMFVSLANTDELAIVDFNKIDACARNCTPAQLAASISYVKGVGFQNPPDLPGNITTSRVLAGGAEHVCVAAVYEQAVYCYHVPTGNISSFTGLEFARRIIFIESASGTASKAEVSGLVNTTFDCSTAPLTLPGAALTPSTTPTPSSSGPTPSPAPKGALGAAIVPGTLAILAVLASLLML